VIVAVVGSGIFVGLNNTLVTTAVMSIAPVPRPVASATYGFVRFIGGGLAPYVAGKLVEHFNVHVPFLLGALAVALAGAALATVQADLKAADAEELHEGPSVQRHEAEAAVHDIPTVEEEAILAAEAWHEDRRYNQGRPS
jgi:MFS family permease